MASSIIPDRRPRLGILGTACMLLAASGFVLGAPPADAQAKQGVKKGGEKKKGEKSEKEKRREAAKKWKAELKLRASRIRELKIKCERSRPDQQWQVIGEIGKIKHAAAVDYLRRKLYFINSVPSMQAQVRAASADALKHQRDKKQPRLAASAATWLKKACEDRWNRREPEGDAVVRNAIKALGELQDLGSKKWFLKMMTNSKIYWAEEAIRGLEKLRDASVISKIIAEWLKAENEGKKTNASDQDRERRSVLGEACGSVLASLTGQQFEKPIEWQKWWNKNKRGFKVKKLPVDEDEEEK